MLNNFAIPIFEANDPIKKPNPCTAFNKKYEELITNQRWSRKDTNDMY